MSIARQRLLLGILLAAGTALVAVNIACTRCASEIRIEIGTFESKDDGMRSSIGKLATEIRRCPRAKLYRVIWLNPRLEGDKSMQEQAVLYDREHKRIGYEDDIYSGITGKAYIVNDEDIQQVAERGGSLEAFAEYDHGGRSGK